MPSRWDRIQDLYYRALERNENDRTQFLIEACDGDAGLRREVESLLDQKSQSMPLFDRPAIELAAESVAEDERQQLGSCKVPPLLGVGIGKYRTIRLIGEGGMGAVYEAEQEQPRRTVALKVIKPGLAGPEVLRRFELESQALGRLQHQGIAQIYEAGTADAGFGPQPYFAMEFIRGRSLREYADSHRLTTRQRMEIMAKVCDAVHHAHQRGLIHRDLKPGNILVDDTGQPKILDFGVARVTDDDTETTLQTATGQIVGTLAYMSPEQVMADPLEIDTRSDIYALGVILYELLAERLPYRLSGKLHEAIQTIREEDPSPLSSINRIYRGDIETIAGKALEKEKARRYTSAAELASDIRRYLSDQPIAARPPSTRYNLQKLARRHRAAVLSVCAVFVALVAGVVASTSQAIRARRAERAALADRDRAVQAEGTARAERDRAASAEQSATEERDRAVAAEGQALQERNKAVKEQQRADTEAATTKAVNGFLQNDLLAQASSRIQAGEKTQPDPEIKVRTVLDRAASQIAGRFDKQPLVEASIRETVGSTYLDLGVYAEAQRQFERSLELRRRALGAEHPDTLITMNDLGLVYGREGKGEEAEALHAQVLEIRRRVLGPEHPATLQSMNNLAVEYQNQGKLAQAAPLYAQVLEIARRVRSPENPATLITMQNLATLYVNQGKYAQAEDVDVQMLEIRRRVLGPEHPDTLITMKALAELYFRQGKFAQEAPLRTSIVEIQRRILGPEHPETLNSMNDLTLVYMRQGKVAEAESLLANLIEIFGRVLGLENPRTLNTTFNLATVYLGRGKFAQAETLVAKTVENERRDLGPDHPTTLSGIVVLANIYSQLGRFAEAESSLANVIDIQNRRLGKEHPATLSNMGLLASVYQREGQPSQAEPIYKKVAEVQSRVAGPEARPTLDTLTRLASVYESEGKYAEAEALFTKVLESDRRVRGAEVHETLWTTAHLAANYEEQGNYAQAEALFSRVLEIARRVSPEDPLMELVVAALGELRVRQRKYSEAEPLLREILNYYERMALGAWPRYQAQSLLGATLASQKRYEEAEKLLVSGYSGLVQQKATIPADCQPAIDAAGERIVRFYQDWKKPEKADEWHEKLSAMPKNGLSQNPGGTWRKASTICDGS